jgi:hypothetical protein
MPVEGRDRHPAGSLSLQGAQGQAPRRETLDVDCATWPWMQGREVTRIPSCQQTRRAGQTAATGVACHRLRRL